MGNSLHAVRRCPIRKIFPEWGSCSIRSAPEMNSTQQMLAQSCLDSSNLHRSG